MGAVTPIGDSVAEFWKNLVAGRSGIGRLDRFVNGDIPVRVAAEVRDFNAADTPSPQPPKPSRRAGSTPPPKDGGQGWSWEPR